jgi:hypothetical protein
MRSFFSIGFASETRIGRAVELHSHQMPDCSPQRVGQADLSRNQFASFSTLSLAEGRRLHSLPADVKLFVARRPFDDLDFDVIVNGIGWIIVSNRLGNAVKDIAPNDVELLPVSILSVNGETLRSDFCVINALKILNAMSEQKSVRSRVKWASGTNPVIKMVLSADNVPSNVHVFRVSGCQNKFIIDELAKGALTKVPHDGLAFIPIDQE